MERMSHEARAERRRRIAAEHKAGASIESLRNKYGLSEDTIRCAVRVNVENLTHMERAERRQQMAREYLDGATIAGLCVEHGLSEDYVRKALRENGVKPRIDLSANAKPSTYRMLSALINTDQTYDEIAAQHNVTRQAIGNIADKARLAGITLHKRRQGDANYNKGE